MNSNDIAKNYLTYKMPFKIADVLVHEDIDVCTEFLDGIVNELLAVNNDFDEKPYLDAALTLQKLRQHKGGKELLDKIEALGEGNKEMINNIVINRYSKDYSANVPVSNYLRLFHDPSIKSVIFEPIKKNPFIETTGHAYGFGKEHNYSIIRSDVVFININSIDHNSSNIWRDKRIKEDTLVSIKLEKYEYPKFKPSQAILKNLKYVSQKWPYPARTESGYDNTSRDKFAAALGRYLPQIHWNNTNGFWKGRFSTEMWTLFLSVLNTESILNESIPLFEKYGSKRLRRITQVFDAPYKELNLDIGNNFDEKNTTDYRSKPDMVFEYYTDGELTKLCLDRIYNYKNNSKSKFNLDRDAF